MTRYTRALKILVVLLPLLPFAASADGSTMLCSPNNPSAPVPQGTAVIISGSINNDPDHTYAILTYPGGLTSGALKAALGKDGIDGTWQYNLGSTLPAGGYTLTVYAEDSDCTPCVCSFTVGAFTPPAAPADKKEHEVALLQGKKPHAEIATTCVHVTDVRVATAGKKQFVQIFGTVDSTEANMTLGAQMTGQVLTDSGPTTAHFLTNKVYRFTAPGAPCTEVYAEFDVTRFPPGVYSVRLTSSNPTAIGSRFRAVKIAGSASLVEP
jgi:hypothetical protein